MKSISKSFFVLLFLINLSLVAQTRKELEAQRKKIKAEIEEVNKLLSQTDKKEKNVLEEIKDINQKIAIRTRYINSINKEANALSKEISTNEKSIKKLDKNLTALKKDYADMIFKSYKSKSQQSRTMFLLSSQNFYQAYKRLQYMKQYTSFRKKQGEEIVSETFKVKRLNDSLLLKKKAKDTLILSEKKQKEQIESDKKSKQILISQINKNQKKYKKTLQAKIKAEKRISDKIDKIIRDAIARSRAAAAKKNAAATKKTKGFALSPEAKKLASRFESNRGRLPWPVSNGYISRKYGKQKHPVFPGIQINSSGLHFTSQRGTKAESIFNGKVTEIILNEGGKKTVVVRHGNYFSAYNNLENIYVNKGDTVSTGQILGQVFTDKITKKTTLVFILYKNTQKLNPSSWISKR
ncbi:MAG: murein hydrolase activator EnvC family protein [Flavobacteriaceae bacterium]